MAGGTSIWASSDYKTDPKAIFNIRLWFVVAAMSWAGCFYGFDSGNIGGILTLPSFKNAMGLDAESDTTDGAGNLAAMLPAGAAVGSVLAAPTSDAFGRRIAAFIWGIIFLTGAAMQMVADYKVVLGGRFIGGLGVGATSMLAPQFLAEMSPKSIRGSVTASYNLMIVTSLMVAFWINYGVSKWNYNAHRHDDSQWRTAMGIQLIPGFLMVAMIPFLLESPRYLINQGNSEKGLINLCKLRSLSPDHEYVRIEYSEIQEQTQCEQEMHEGHSYWAVLKDIFTVKSNFNRFFLAVMLFLFHKFTGTDSLNYFAPEIFSLIGIRGDSTPLLTTGVYGAVKVVTTIFYIAFLVDRVGRRLPLIVGATIQATCMLYLGLYLRFGDPAKGEGTPAGGYVGAVAIYIYAFGWSFGHSVACYVFAAEVFPARIRSVCMSICFCVNWTVDYGITRATPNMINEMGWGVFLLYAMLTYIGAVWIFFTFPELKGRSIESMDDLFQRPFWLMWKFAYPSEEDKVRHGVKDRVQKGEDAVADMGQGEKDETTYVERVVE